ncbi:MAG: TIGR04282 family arsenosugar biosynthesis glycosyltransferase [Planctomycetota bacterium]
MAKYWAPGTVKTRLAAAIGETPAAKIHRIFVLHLLGEMAELTCGSAVSNDERDGQSPAESSHDRHVYCLVAPDDSADEMRRTWELSRPESLETIRPPAWDSPAEIRFIGQGPGDLTRRLGAWFQSRDVSPGIARVVIGTDLPTLSPRMIEESAALLAQHDAVLGPAADGGYYLLGLSSDALNRTEAATALFEGIDWSTPAVAGQTRDRMRQLGLSWAELPIDEDIDDVDCLRRLISKLQSSPPSDELVPHGRRLLNYILDAIPRDLRHLIVVPSWR